VRDYSEEIEVLNAVIREYEAEVKKAEQSREDNIKRIEQSVPYTQSASDSFNRDSSLRNIQTNASLAIDRGRDVNKWNHRIFAIKQVLKLLEKMHVEDEEDDE
jgi:hypothetical protein